ncbi:MAG: ATP-binding protein, partial [Acidimicrobiales bacterium]
RALPASERADRLGPLAGELARLVPHLDSLVPGLPPPLAADPDTERWRLFTALSSALAQLAEPDGLVLVLDDLHWASRPTALLFTHVVADTPSHRLLLVGTFRDTELARGNAFTDTLADLHRRAAVERIRLTGLDLEGVRLMLAGALRPGEERLGPSAPADRLVERIHAETDGNPYFVTEVIRHLRETSLDGLSGDTGAGLGIPEGVRHIVDHRLGRLSDVTDAVLSAGAVLSGDMEVAVLAALTGIHEDAALDSLEEAATAGLVVEVDRDRWRFAQTLMRAATLERLPLTRQGRLHRRAAEVLSRPHPDEVGAIAHHWLAAVPPHPAMATAAAVVAGDVALAQLDADNAARWFRSALDLLAGGGGDDRQRCEVAIKLGRAQLVAGDPAHRRTLLDAATLARRLGDPRLLADAALAGSRGMWSAAGEVDDERVDVLDASLAALPRSDDPVRAVLLATLAAELAFSDRRDACTALADEAEAMARRVGHGPTLGHILLSNAVTCAVPDRVGRSEAALEEVAELADRSGDPLLQVLASINLSNPLLMTGDVAGARRHTARARALVEERGHPSVRWMVTSNEACRALYAGRVEEAETRMEQSLQEGTEAGAPDALAWYAPQLASLRRDQGRVEEFLPLGEALAPTSTRLAWRAALAALSALAGLTDDAERFVREDAGTLLQRLPYDLVWLAGVTQMIQACSLVGVTEPLPGLLAAASPWAHQLVYPGTVLVGSVHFYLGEGHAALGARSAAEMHFGEALATHARTGAPGWEAWTKLEWGAWLHRWGDRARAHRLVGEAVDAAERLGMAGVVRRADVSTG